MKNVSQVSTLLNETLTVLQTVNHVMFKMIHFSVILFHPNLDFEDYLIHLNILNAHMKIPVSGLI